MDRIESDAILGYAEAQFSCPVCRMLQRVISSVLVLTLVGWGTSWAYPGHLPDDLDHVLLGVHEHAQPGQEDSGCDHCCHVSAHMTGVVSPPLRKFAGPPVNIYPQDAGCAVATRFSDPPLKPPRS